MNKRDFLKSSLATAGASMIAPGISLAGNDAPALSTLSDGNLVLPGAMVLGGLPEAAMQVLAEQGVSPDRLEPECNLALLRREGRTILFDAGAGPTFMASAGTLPDSLDAAGLYPEDITDIVFTHAHPDHLWGILDDFDDVAFPEARLHMGRVERDYWLDPATTDSIGADRQAFVAGALRRLEAIADRLEVFEDGAEILPGIAAWMTPGHTPGHMAFEVRDGTQSTLILGDAIGNHHVSFANPAWEVGSDQDTAQGAATRARIFDRVVSEDMALVGFHLPMGGIGRAAPRQDGGFRFVTG